MKNVEALKYKVMLKCHVRAKMQKKIKKDKNPYGYMYLYFIPVGKFGGDQGFGSTCWARLQFLETPPRRGELTRASGIMPLGGACRMAENDGWSSGNEATGAVSDNRYL